MSEQKELDLFLEPDVPEADIPEQADTAVQAAKEELPVEAGINELREQLELEKKRR